MIGFRRVAENPGERGRGEGPKIGKGVPFRVKWGGLPQRDLRGRIRKVHERVTETRWEVSN